MRKEGVGSGLTEWPLFADRIKEHRFFFLFKAKINRNYQMLAKGKRSGSKGRQHLLLKQAFFFANKRVAPGTLSPLSLHSSWAASGSGEHPETCHPWAATDSQPACLSAPSLSLFMQQTSHNGDRQATQTLSSPCSGQATRPGEHPEHHPSCAATTAPSSWWAHTAHMSAGLWGPGEIVLLDHVEQLPHKTAPSGLREVTILPNTEETEGYVPNQRRRQIPRKRP